MQAINVHMCDVQSITAALRMPTYEYWGSAEQQFWEGEQFFCDNCGCGKQYVTRRADELCVKTEEAICCEVILR